MKIIRNGIEFELTGKELFDAHREYERDCLIEDIVGKAAEMEVDLKDKDINQLADMVDKALGNNDSYWDSYWMTIEYVVKNC